MKKYNFDEIIDRSKTDTLKWSKKYLGEHFNEAEALPLWVADMDFKTAEPIIEAITERALHGIYGYGRQSDEFLDAAVGWQRKRNDWQIEKEWILFTPGIVPALNFIIDTFCHPGDKIIVQSPVYFPFYSAIKSNGCHISNNPLVLKDGKYEMNFDELEELAGDSKAKMLILCSPHNPVGRVWTKEELTRVGEICLKNDVLVVSDEIHSDLIYKPNKHIPFGKISEEFKMNSIVCTSPSKTFNLAGLQVSDIIVPNEKLRKDLGNKLSAIDIDPGTFAAVAQIAAYNQGEDWLEQLLEYISGNFDFIENFIKERLPKVKFIRPQATYLAWLGFDAYGLSPDELKNLIQKEAKLALGSGIAFGQGGETYQRVNCACPRSILQEAMERMAKALETLPLA